MLLEACLDWNKPKRVIYEGRVVEAFNSQLPIDSVTVYLCEGSVFPLSPIPCSYTKDTLSDESGYFYLETVGRILLKVYPKSKLHTFVTF